MATTRRLIPVIGDSVVHVGRGLLSLIPGEIISNKSIKASKYVVISDHNVWSLHGKRLTDSFMEAGCSTDFKADGNVLLTYQVEPGEKSKCRAVKAEIEDFMLEHKCLRDTCVVALGGGVIGDLAGYVAATYMRGVPVVQVPTSTMAMCDSSVGGKTAINVPAGKNLIGAFWQPRVVYADMDLLATLGRRELVEGIAEAIKMGCIRKPGLFELLEASPDKVKQLDPATIQEVVYQAILGKAEVVAQDEREQGLRGTLNWGHTIGHAIEAIKSPALFHGECVSIGCIAEAELALELGYEPLNGRTIERIRACFASYGLPTEFPKTGLDVPTLMLKMGVDKKNIGNTIRVTVVKDIGVSLTNPQPVTKDVMEAALAAALKSTAAAVEWIPLEGTVQESLGPTAKRQCL